MRAPLTPPRLSLPRNEDAAAHVVSTQLRDRQAGLEDARLERRSVGRVDQIVVHGGHTILPHQLLGGDLGTEVPVDRTHVAMRELEPGARERVGERLGVVLEAARDRVVRGIGAQRQVAREHAGLTTAVRVRERHHVGAAAVDRTPLVPAAGAAHELPLVRIEDVEELVVPAGRVVGPRHLEAGGDGVVAVPRAVAVLPAEALLLETGCLGVVLDVGVGRGAVRLAEGVATRDERNGLLVVHRHAAEGLADVASRGQRVGVAVGALGIDVDEAHLHSRERLLELAVAGVALVVQPGGLGAPVHVGVGLPHIGATAGVAEGLEAHGLQRHVAGEDHQVGPRERLAVLLLDGPEEAPGLVEVDVVGPAVQRREALLTGAAAAAAVGRTIGARAVPGHADHEGAVVAEVGGPPVLRRREGLGDVGLDRGQIERLERRLVVEVLAERVRDRGVLRQDLEVQLIRPPHAVGVARCRVGLAAVDHRAALGLVRPRPALAVLALVDRGVDRGDRLIGVGGVLADGLNALVDGVHGFLPGADG